MGCICCANGNDLPDGEYCRACLHGADGIFMKLEGAELDAFLQEIGMNPTELLAQFNTVFPDPVSEGKPCPHLTN